MRTVWKFELRSRNRSLEQFEDVTIPRESKFIAAAVVDGVFTVWAEVSSTSLVGSRRIWVVGTGTSIPEGVHFATIFDNGYVWHLYDGGINT